MLGLGPRQPSVAPSPEHQPQTNHVAPYPRPCRCRFGALPGACQPRNPVCVSGLAFVTYCSLELVRSPLVCLQSAGLCWSVRGLKTLFQTAYSFRIFMDIGCVVSH
eukprot:3661859-Pleurochrysis_carterae.AAC.1